MVSPFCKQMARDISMNFETTGYWIAGQSNYDSSGTGITTACDAAANTFLAPKRPSGGAQRTLPPHLVFWVSSKLRGERVVSDDSGVPMRLFFSLLHGGMDGWMTLVLLRRIESSLSRNREWNRIS
jgi:hypothetical protein